MTDLLEINRPAMALTFAGGESWLARGSVSCQPEGQLADKLLESARDKRPLRIKLGLDPTAPDIHLGHTVVLERLRDFQMLGHTVVLIIGDYTARIGDPSGRSKTRPQLDPVQIDAAAATYSEQAFRILDPEKTEVRRNSEWLDMKADEMFALLRTTTVARILERDDFAGRLRDGAPVSMLELLYPLIQAYDSVAVNADVELGGTDQTFNLLLARDVQRHYGQPEQVCLTFPLLRGIDGVEKMSKSLGNTVSIADSAVEIHGRTMSIPDSLIDEWEQLLFEQQSSGTPYERKRRLARSLAERFAGPGAGAHAEEHFDRVFKQHQVPEDIDELEITGTVHLPELLERAFAVSRGEARRHLQGGGVRLNGIKLSGDLDRPATALDGVLQLGKKRFVRLRAR